ncbi:right-handed parallel beta-helix repeat-containing protein [Hazenella sp. IB182357]|uniref:Right-handed parallel beta-helix repeat-containing protein n=1 Tax=Polycladospora coralii TaxID=2771432 RepID=A0A926NCQ6_9BACL|nr:right-handed parallel beta-helix repeat-containing protein [Polycladospora coralii]MBD1371184.1 right-handed parallel beta-helix repeat-containing protein [Polycladospora coralii]MBS7530126.1 right-handed parallel beta-helix repeat-containing protein [Polycladospora coralii]
MLNIKVPTDYSTIQAAVDAANPGDTIFVELEGSPYFESVHITTDHIKIIGIRNPILHGKTLNADASGFTLDHVKNVVINGFTVMRFGKSAFMIRKSRQNLIRKNRLLENETGITLNQANENRISKNEILSNTGAGISLTHAHINKLQRNTIMRNTDHGVIYRYASSNQSNHNQILSNYNDGIFLYYADSNQFKYNQIIGNKDEGIDQLCSNHNYFAHNKIAHNDSAGIQLYFSSHNQFKKNILTKNMDSGIVIDSSTNNQIEDNQLIENEDFGLLLRQNAKNNDINTVGPLCLTSDSFANNIMNHHEGQIHFEASVMNPHHFLTQIWGNQSFRTAHGGDHFDNLLQQLEGYLNDFEHLSTKQLIPLEHDYDSVIRMMIQHPNKAFIYVQIHPTLKDMISSYLEKPYEKIEKGIQLHNLMNPDMPPLSCPFPHDHSSAYLSCIRPNTQYQCEWGYYAHNQFFPLLFSNRVESPYRTDDISGEI